MVKSGLQCSPTSARKTEKKCPAPINLAPLETNSNAINIFVSRFVDSERIVVSPCWDILCKPGLPNGWEKGGGNRYPPKQGRYC